MREPANPTPTAPSPVAPLGAWEERIGHPVFMLFYPRLPRVSQPPPPERLAPFELLRIPRRHGEGTLSGTFFPASGEARGAVLLLHPWLEWGQAYFHRRRRIETLREAGFHALTLDLPDFGDSGPRSGLFDHDVEDGLAELARRAPGLPLSLWGVSAGGYWAHPALARTPAVRSAFFEEVSPHLIEWGWRQAPWGFPGYLIVRVLFPRLYRYLDMRRHAATLTLDAITYVSGEEDRGVRPEDTRALALAARARARIVPGAGHLEAIKRANQEVLDLALATFTGNGRGHGATGGSDSECRTGPEERTGNAEG